MKGAEDTKYLKTGQYGRLYILCSSHARGNTLQIWILPEDEQAEISSANNPPLNKNKVQVYGIKGGQPGWTEYYDWLHEGEWQEDYAIILKEAIQADVEAQLEKEDSLSRRERIIKEREEALLESYSSPNKKKKGFFSNKE